MYRVSLYSGRYAIVAACSLNCLSAERRSICHCDDKEIIPQNLSTSKQQQWLFPVLSTFWSSSLFSSSLDDQHFTAYKSESYWNSWDESKDYDAEGLMSWPSLIDGLERRANAEVEAREFLQNIKAADRQVIEKLGDGLARIMYGGNLTLHDREKALERYGCAVYTRHSLATIASYAKVKGVVEVGAGNGQWARQLRDQFQVNIVAFDSMQSLPLQTVNFSADSVARSQYFLPDIAKEDETVLAEKGMLRHNLFGRVLLIIFPDPGGMALHCLKNYYQSSKENDTFIYVGEGKGGANGNDAFFDELERSGRWRYVYTCETNPFGDHAFERLFVFQRIRK